MKNKYPVIAVLSTASIRAIESLFEEKGQKFHIESEHDRGCEFCTVLLHENGVYRSSGKQFVSTGWNPAKNATSECGVELFMKSLNERLSAC